MIEQWEQILKMLPLVNKAADGILRVRELHKVWHCDDEEHPIHCEHCGGDYPCDTIKALDGEQ